MRPAPFISPSNARTRTPRSASDSSGGLSRTGTLTSTWGYLRMQVDSDARSSPVSPITESRASAERPDATGQPLGMERAAPGVDVGAVGPARRAHHAGPQAPEEPRRDPIGGAVGAVERDGEAAEVEGEAVAQELHVVRLGAIVG